jgi:hypothetical protein
MDTNSKFIETMDSFCTNDLIEIVKRIPCNEYDDILDNRDDSEFSDLAAYLSDDVALLSEAALCNYDNSWVNGMWNEYSKGRLPHGEIPLIAVSAW